MPSKFSLSTKLLIAAAITGIINNTSGFMILHITEQPIYGILWINLFGAITGYITNSYVYGVYNIVWVMFLRWIIITCLTLFINIKLFKYIENFKKVKEWKNKLSGLKLTIFNYILILLTSWIIFILWIYIMTKNYVFVYRQSKTINYLDVILLCIMIFIVGVDQYFAEIQTNMNTNTNMNHEKRQIKDL